MYYQFLWFQQYKLIILEHQNFYLGLDYFREISGINGTLDSSKSFCTISAIQYSKLPFRTHNKKHFVPSIGQIDLQFLFLIKTDDWFDYH